MRKSVYPALDVARHASHPLPMGATPRTCGLCHERIAPHDKAVTYQTRIDAPTIDCREPCMRDDLTRVVALLGRTGGVRAFDALRRR